MITKAFIYIVFFQIYQTSVLAQCWIGSYGRGVGSVADTCKSGYEKDGALCYKQCKDGYKGVAMVCWEKCPSGYKDWGLTCVKLWKVKTKKSYTRGAGDTLGCKSGMDKDGGICYKSCKSGYKGVGPVCWFKGCKGAMSNSCGLLCTTNKAQCTDVNIEIAGASASIMESITEMVSTGLSNPTAWLDFFASTTELSYILINDVCDGSNYLPSYCIKTVDDNISWSKCSGNNSVDCGLFCASSKIMCVKQIVKVVSGVLTIISSASSLDFKGAKEESYDLAKKVLSKDFPDIGTILKTRKIPDLSLEKSKALLEGLVSIFEVITPSDNTKFCS
ncbi:unnamed protein product [Brachionus calyciflorus]|uniref:Uncharacterized protein n=1 Tax=Brachionus calyciflorus TaxID=104777 RepID=A0A813UYF7_9BILA|nr:unnamed protein product [Brachionus calyciflorus]